MQKYVFLKLDLKVTRQYFRYKEYINWLQIDEILTYVFMHEGPSTSSLRYAPLKNDVTILNTFSGLETRFRYFPTPGDYLFVEFFLNELFWHSVCCRGFKLMIKT